MEALLIQQEKKDAKEMFTILKKKKKFRQEENTIYKMNLKLGSLLIFGGA